MYLRVIPKLLEGFFQEKEQKGKSSFYRKFTPDDRKINWHKSIYLIARIIRSSTKPYPGAFAIIKDQEFIIWEAQVFDSQINYQNAEIGEIVEIFNEKDFLVNGVDGTLLIRDSEIKPSLGLIFN